MYRPCTFSFGNCLQLASRSLRGSSRLQPPGNEVNGSLFQTVQELIQLDQRALRKAVIARTEVKKNGTQ